MTSEEAKEYIYRKNIPQLFESLMTGLMFHKPGDHIAYLRNCLDQLKADDVIGWDEFVRTKGKTTPLPPISPRTRAERSRPSPAALAKASRIASPTDTESPGTPLPPISDSKNHTLEEDEEILSSRAEENAVPYRPFSGYTKVLTSIQLEHEDQGRKPDFNNFQLISIMGSPGSGRKEISEKVCANVAVSSVLFSMAAILERSRDSLEAEDLDNIQCGKLVTNDEMVVDLLRETLLGISAQIDVVFIEGFPRTAGQLNLFYDRIGGFDRCILLDCEEEYMKQQYTDSEGNLSKVYTNKYADYKYKTLPILGYLDDRAKLTVVTVDKPDKCRPYDEAMKAVNSQIIGRAVTQDVLEGSISVTASPRSALEEMRLREEAVESGRKVGKSTSDTPRSDKDGNGRASQVSVSKSRSESRSSDVDTKTTTAPRIDSRASVKSGGHKTPVRVDSRASVIKSGGDETPVRADSRASVNSGDKTPVRADSRASADPRDKTPSKVDSRASADPRDKTSSRVDSRVSVNPGNKTPSRVDSRVSVNPGNKTPVRVDSRASINGGDKMPVREDGRAIVNIDKTPARADSRASVKSGDKTPSRTDSRMSSDKNGNDRRSFNSGRRSVADNDLTVEGIGLERSASAASRQSGTEKTKGANDDDCIANGYEEEEEFVDGGRVDHLSKINVISVIGYDKEKIENLTNQITSEMKFSILDDSRINIDDILDALSSDNSFLVVVNYPVTAEQLREFNQKIGGMSGVFHYELEEDSETKSEKEFQLFEQNLKPVLDFYDRENLLITSSFDEDETVDKFLANIKTILDSPVPASDAKCVKKYQPALGPGTENPSHAAELAAVDSSRRPKSSDVGPVANKSEWDGQRRATIAVGQIDEKQLAMIDTMVENSINESLRSLKEREQLDGGRDVNASGTDGKDSLAFPSRL